jgi:hypothetical protein
MFTTATAPTQNSFVKQMLDFFGRLPGQGLTDFYGELKTLSAEDKHEFAVMLTAAGFPCELPQPASAA